MRRIVVLLALVFIFTVGLIIFLKPSSSYAQNASQMLPDQLLIKFDRRLTPQLKAGVIADTKNQIGEAVTEDENSAVGEQLSKINVMTIQVSPGKLAKVLAYLQKNKQFVVEPNFVAQKAATANDPSIDKEWGLYKMQVASASGLSAWDVTTGNSDIKVAVLDTGIYKDHLDLQGRVILEKDFTNSASGVADKDGHGTHVAGSIAANTNNGVGVAGVSYTASILNGKVLGDSGSGSYSGIAAGLIWAADNGAKVINLSLGGSVDSSTLKDAIDYTVAKGAVVVAAAGNNGNTVPLYPANYSSVLSVAATDQSDVKPSWSTYGSWVNVTAPGVSIYSTYKDGGYATYSGTSMATSYVSGVAVLVWAANHCATNSCVVGAIETGADKIGGTGSYWQYGRVNAYNAVVAGSSPTNTPTPTLSSPPSPTPTPTATPTPTLSPTDGPTATPTPTGGPVDTPTPTQTPTPTLSPSATPTPTIVTQPTMTVSNLELWSTSSSFVRDISTRVTISDSNSKLVSNAKVTVRLTTPSGIAYSGSGQTNSSGQISFILRRQFAKGTYMVTVTDVVKSGFTYNPTITTKTLTI